METYKYKYKKYKTMYLELKEQQRGGEFKFDENMGEYISKFIVDLDKFIEIDEEKFLITNFDSKFVNLLSENDYLHYYNFFIADLNLFNKNNDVSKNIGNCKFIKILQYFYDKSKYSIINEYIKFSVNMMKIYKKYNNDNTIIDILLKIIKYYNKIREDSKFNMAKQVSLIESQYSTYLENIKENIINEVFNDHDFNNINKEMFNNEGFKSYKQIIDINDDKYFTSLKKFFNLSNYQKILENFNTILTKDRLKIKFMLFIDSCYANYEKLNDDNIKNNNKLMNTYYFKNYKLLSNYIYYNCKFTAYNNILKYTTPTQTPHTNHQLTPHKH